MKVILLNYTLLISASSSQKNECEIIDLLISTHIVTNINEQNSAGTSALSNAVMLEKIKAVEFACCVTAPTVISLFMMDLLPINLLKKRKIRS